MGSSPREQRKLGQIQAGILDAVKASRPARPPSDDEIATVLGVDRSMCSRWRSGERVMSPLILVELAGRYGGEVLREVVGEGYLIAPVGSTGRVTTLRREGAAIAMRIAAINQDVLGGRLENVSDSLYSLAHEVAALVPLARRRRDGGT